MDILQDVRGHQRVTSATPEGAYEALQKDGVDLVDNSKLFVAQVQHGFSFWDDRQDFTYGIDYFGTRPDTDGSINGSYEDSDNMDEWGVYLQSKTVLSPKFDLVLAGRMASHSSNFSGRLSMQEGRRKPYSARVDLRA